MTKFFAFLTLVLVLLFCTNSDGQSHSDVKHYIVYMGGHSYPNSKSVRSANHGLLASVLGSVALAKNATVYHYTKSFRGFSAKLTLEQANQISKENSVVSVFEDKSVHLMTTRSWEFMETKMFKEPDIGEVICNGNAPYTFNKRIYANKDHSGKANSSYKDHYGQEIYASESSDVIIGFIDGGIWPEALSFSDFGLGPVPDKFRGAACSGNCSRKIISGRYYYKGYEEANGPLKSDGRPFYLSARDSEGHGTHVASIAAGAKIRLTMPGLGKLPMHGGAPGARLSVYKVCWWDRCVCSDIMAAYDDAIHDNVDIISISLGINNVSTFYDDCFAGPALEAFKRGIFVSAAGGNSGGVGTVSNAWPWFTTVAASSIDRVFISMVVLGNSINLQGYGINPYDTPTYFSIISGEHASLCKPGTVDSSWINGRIVICEWDPTFETQENWNTAVFISQQGGAGVIFTSPTYQNDQIPQSFPIVSSLLDPTATRQLYDYLNSNSDPVAKILSSDQFYNNQPDPRVAEFSSRGPSRMLPTFIKPDLTAPGVNIIGAFPAAPHIHAAEPTRGIMSGTSMACPHVSGVAALIKNLHKDWSPAAIRSALMTTATGVNNAGCSISSNDNVATPLDLGSGHLNPRKALDPGLVYDFGNADLAEFSCSFFEEDWVQKQFNMTIDCKKARPFYFLNYPSIAVSSKVWPANVTRTLSYVGGEDRPKSFAVLIDAPAGTEVMVRPSVIDFTAQRDVTYTVTFFPGEDLPKNEFYFGSITWRNSAYEVRSPISVFKE